MISEKSCDIEDCWKFSFVITGINYILKYIKIENIYSKFVILHNITVFTVSHVFALG